MAGTFNLTFKVQDAIQSVVESVGLSGVAVNTGTDEADLAVPYVICSCNGSSGEMVPFSGNFKMNAAVKIVSSADDSTRAEHDARMYSVYDALIADGIAATLTAAVTDFHVFNVAFVRISEDVEDRKFISMLEMEVVCCGTDL